MYKKGDFVYHRGRDETGIFIEQFSSNESYVYFESEEEILLVSTFLLTIDPHTNYNDFVTITKEEVFNIQF